MQQGILLSLHLPGSILQLLTTLPDIASPGWVIGQPTGRSRRAGESCRGHQSWLQGAENTTWQKYLHRLQRWSKDGLAMPGGGQLWHLQALRNDLPESMILPAASAKLAQQTRRNASLIPLTFPGFLTHQVSRSVDSAQLQAMCRFVYVR